MMQTLELLSPAKINLFLDVIGKRKDIYHDIVTVFEKIDFCDRIEFTPLDRKPYLTEPLGFNNGIEITSDRSELPTDKNNLVYRACSLLKKKYGISKAVKIHIEKRIPIAAGLGGGSSNAATTLKGLNRLWNLNIKDSELSNLGKEIGTDVPFFIFNHSFALGSARGDEINPIKSDLQMWHVVITPPVRVLTKEIYERYDDTNLNLTDIGPDVRIIVRAIEKKDFGEIKKHLYNALEPIVSKKVTDISRAKDFIKKKGFDAVCVTGSGPAIFVLTSNRKEAEDLKEKLVKSFVSSRLRNDWKIFVAKTATIVDT